MGKMELKDLSKAIAKIDICMMATRSSDGKLGSRPMSNNKDVEFDGDCYFFSMGDTSAVQDLKNDNHTCLSYQHHHLYICVSGLADLITDKIAMKEHWVKDLEIWFKDGIDTPGLTLIHVKADHVKYWDKHDEGEFRL